MSSEEQQGGGVTPTPPAKSHPNPIARLRELLSVPERVRTEAQWDEIIEIEITLGPRKSPLGPSGGHSGSKQHGQAHFRQNDQRGERQERKQGQGQGGGGNKQAQQHMRKRNNKDKGGGSQGNAGGAAQGNNNSNNSNQNAGGAAQGSAPTPPQSGSQGGSSST